MIRYILQEIGLAMLSFLIPILAIFIPVNRIKFLKTNTKKNSIIATLILSTVILAFSISTFKNGYFLLVYISIYMIPSFSYLYFEKYFEKWRNKVGIIDYIVIGSVLSSIIVFIAYFLNIQEVAKMLQETKTFYYQFAQIDKKIIDEMFAQMVFYIPAGIYFTTFIINYYLYAFYKRGENKNWTISYLYILIFIAAQLLVLYVYKENMVLLNILIMVKLGYIIFGGIALYEFIMKSTKSRVMAILTTTMSYIVFADVLFVVGAIFSFFPAKVFETKEKKDDEENN